VLKVLDDIHILSATHTKEFQRLKKFFEEVTIHVQREIDFFEQLNNFELLQNISAIEYCRMCKHCCLVQIDKGTGSELIQKIVEETNNWGANKANEAFARNNRANFTKIRNFAPENRPPSEQQSTHKGKDEEKPFSKFNISSRNPFIKTPLINGNKPKTSENNQSRKSLSGEDLDLGMNSKEHNRGKSEDIKFDTVNNRSVKLEPLNNEGLGPDLLPPFLRKSADRMRKSLTPPPQPPPKEKSEMESLMNQATSRINSLKDTRMKELETNSNFFEKKTRSLVAQLVECKAWIPIPFLIRLTHEQIQKNYPIENFLEKSNLMTIELSAFLDELKVVIECSKTLLSKSSYMHA
jgi:hypothetical protein